MDPTGKAATNAAQAMEQTTTAAVSAASAIASTSEARAAATCACCRKGCPACDMLAQVHTGEAIVPAAFNPWPEALALGREIVRLSERIARVLDRWDDDGVPRRSNPL